MLVENSLVFSGALEYAVKFSTYMADFQNVSIQSLYAVLLRYINYVDRQSYQTVHQLLIRCLITF